MEPSGRRGTPEEDLQSHHGVESHHVAEGHLEKGLMIGPSQNLRLVRFFRYWEISVDYEIGEEHH
ncbi:hypothetical protein N7509_002958 [Penicillium cosmopolitanum]|uniref:Uncharacterized protein n=1 Tax=Penicillium cosmopolitanum TaxID=1131564 RepID=A0A9W9WAF4_9EURO|nr:uncharacterized protein N7509_002958 [Penicillium cosmopolitanum]KAJ5409075.1 hypothetical protein N7509_002958 [Penicillium cosmopolitanum]